MKRAILILIFITFCLSAWAQCPPTGNVTFTYQQTIDNFVANYPNCTEISGNMRITGVEISGDITSLSSLNQITSVGGYLYIEGLPLTSLDGLENITSIGGSLRINLCYQLTSLEGLGNLTTIGGDFSIANSSSWTDFTGLENLTAIGGDLKVFNCGGVTDFEGLNAPVVGGKLDIYANDALVSLNGLEGISSFEEVYIKDNDILASLEGLNMLNSTEKVTIWANNALTDLTGLNSLSNVSGRFDILYNDGLMNLTGLENLINIGGLRINQTSALSSLNGLDNLVTIDGNVSIQNNDALADLSALNSLTNLNGKLEIYTNNALTSLAGLENVIASGITELGVASNPNLSICELPNICEYLQNDSLVNIFNNALGCDSQTEIEAACMPVNVCPQGDVGLWTQSEVDNFILTYPACTELSGSLYIGDDLGGSDIENLGGFANITSIAGNLWISQNYALSTLSGLQNLSTVNGYLLIHENTSLTSLEGLENIDPATITNLIIRYNSNLAVCDVNSICNYLEAGGTATIFANAPGCDSQSEIEALCLPPCGGDGTTTDSLTHIYDEDLFIDAVGFADNPNITFTDPATPVDAVLSDISLELYFRLNSNSCENEIAIQITDPIGNTQPLTAYTTCNGGNGLYYVNLDIPNTTGGAADWLIEFDDTNDQNSDYEYSVRFARLKYTTTTVGSSTVVNEVSEYADMDLFIDGVGFENNGTYTFPDPGTPADAVLSDISLELYFRLNGNSCENEIAIQITDPAGNTQALTAYTTCNGGTNLFYVNLDVSSGSTTGSPADWLVQFDDTNDQNADYEYSVRFGRLTYTSTYTQGVSGSTPVTVNEQVSEYADTDLFIDGVGFANNGNYTFTDPGTPADAVLSDISLELYFRLNGNSCENEIAIQITDPAGNTQPLTAYTACDGGNGLFYVNLDVPSGSTTGSPADWVVEFDDTNDQNTDYEYSVRFGRLTYDTEYTECVPMKVSEKDESQQLHNSSTPQPAKNNNSSTRQLNNSSLKLYPVPASHLLNVEYFSENTNSTNIEILSNEGKMLMQKEEFLQEGMNTIQLDIADLPAGHYHIRMYNASDMQMQSFVKIVP